MAEIVTRPATAELWGDVQHALTGGGDGGSCWCMWWYLSEADYRTTPADGLREILHHQLREGPPRAVLAYVDGEAVGWCRVAPRAEQRRLSRTQVVRRGARAGDQPQVWAISCLVIRRSHRGQGLTRVLVDAAVDLARAGGARVVEAYPRDTGGDKKSSNSLYVGTTAMFTRAGFTEVSRPTPNRTVMELVLD